MALNAIAQRLHANVAAGADETDPEESHGAIKACTDDVQHKPEAYYDIIDTEAAGMGSSAPPGSAREWLSIYDGGRLGYGITNKEELEMIARVGAASGVLLDHVYTGKALFHFAEHARSNPEQFRGKRILFWHTGGLPGLEARSQELVGLVEHPERDAAAAGHSP